MEAHSSMRVRVHGGNSHTAKRTPPKNDGVTQECKTSYRSVRRGENMPREGENQRDNGGYREEHATMAATCKFRVIGYRSRMSDPLRAEKADPSIFQRKSPRGPFYWTIVRAIFSLSLFFLAFLIYHATRCTRWESSCKLPSSVLSKTVLKSRAGKVFPISVASVAAAHVHHCRREHVRLDQLDRGSMRLSSRRPR